MGIKEYHNGIINNHENNSRLKFMNHINYGLLMKIAKFKVLIQRKERKKTPQRPKS
jgi:hypothetical protein